MKMMERILSLLIVVLLITLPCQITFAEQPTWENRKSQYRATGNEWPVKPAPDYVSEQNPPDFSWPKVEDATGYELIVCEDKELKNIKYENRNLKNNFYNFPNTFEPGTYYWSVRYINQDGTSDWSEPSRFLLVPTAYEYTIQNIDDAISKFPSSHPRICVSADELDSFRLLKNKEGSAKRYFDQLVSQVKNYMAQPIPPEPVYDPKNSAGLRGSTMAMQNIMMKSAIVYMIDRDPEVGKFCASVMESVAGWDIYGATAYEHQDQAFREIVYGTSIAFDWAYDAINETQKTLITNMLQTRMTILEHPTVGLTDAPYRIPDCPYMSHGWTASQYLMLASIATLGEVDVSEKILKKYIPIYSNIAPAWAREDGGWCQGTGYAAGSVCLETMLVYNLDKYGIATMSNKAYFRNAYKYSLYMLGPDAGAAFGDQSTGKFDSNWATTNMFLFYVCQNGYARWQKEKYGYGALGVFENYYLPQKEPAEAKEPIDLPRSVAFKDIGWVSMNSDLLDLSGRVSLYFKSSPFGSYNHFHADQNSFTIVAYGQELACDSGYYDSYFSPFDLGYYKRSFAHNTLSFDNGKGQQAMTTMNAHGNITNYITHPDFDLATGSAADAYNYEYIENWGASNENNHSLDKFDRSIIYIRPDQFIVIDDVKKGNGKKSTFEFWLNAKENLEMYKSGDGAKITKKNAVLETKVQYPEVKGSFSDLFSGTDLVGLTPGSTYATQAVHQRVWFTTPECEQTKIVTTMSTHKTDEPAQYVYTKNSGDVLEMLFEDGTKAYVNLTDGEVEAGGFKTDATAIVTKQDSVMAVDATKVERNGETLFTSDKKASYIFGKSEMSISCREDVKVTVKTGNVEKIVNEKGQNIAPGKMEYGYNWSCDGEIFTAEVYKGFYTMYLNNKILPGSPAEDKELKYTIDSKEYTVTASGYYNHDGKKVLAATIANNTDFYVLDKASEVNIKSNSKPGEMILLRAGETVYLEGENPQLALKSFAGENVFKGDQTFDTDEMKSKCTAFVEAEDFVSKDSGARGYDTRAFLSGGQGLTDFNVFGDSITWNINVPEDGVYDLVLKYVGWSGENGCLQRIFSIGGQMGSCDIPETGTYGQVPTEWMASRVNCGVNLKAGMNTLILYPKIGNWNMDWIGLIKR